MQDTILEKMEERKARLEKILENSRERLKAIDTIQDAEDVRIKVLGKKGELTEMLKSMGKMDPEGKGSKIQDGKDRRYRTGQASALGNQAPDYDYD